MKTSIHYSEEICKRLEAKKLTETISPYAMEYINTIMLTIFSTGYHGKTVDMEKCSDKPACGYGGRPSVASPC